MRATNKCSTECYAFAFEFYHVIGLSVHVMLALRSSGFTSSSAKESFVDFWHYSRGNDCYLFSLILLSIFWQNFSLYLLYIVGWLVPVVLAVWYIMSLYFTYSHNTIKTLGKIEDFYRKILHVWLFKYLVERYTSGILKRLK